jgi:hypothetical protein
MRRRTFVTLMAGATALWPLIARAGTSRRLGFLSTVSAQTAKALGALDAIIQGLKEHGWIEGQNFTFEYRFADGKMDALPKLAAELVRLRVDAIVTDGTLAIQALKNATFCFKPQPAGRKHHWHKSFVGGLDRQAPAITERDGAWPHTRRRLVESGKPEQSRFAQADASCGAIAQHRALPRRSGGAGSA